MSTHDAVIPALEPYGLHIVPGYVPGDESWRTRWRDWRDQMFILRDDLDELCAADPAAQADELAACADDPAYFVAMYCWTDDPRPTPGENAIKPFVPFAQQVELIRWFQNRMALPEATSFISKSREWGGTTILCATATHGWLFGVRAGDTLVSKPRILLISRKEELVDKPLDAGSMFGMIDFTIDHLPEWMLPQGFDPEEHRLSRMLFNPATGAQITGEATTSKSLRGLRGTWILYDEGAFIKGFREVLGTGSGSSRHRFAISTESFSEGREWYEMWTGSKEKDPDSVRELEYFHNPYKDPEWYDRTREEWEARGDLNGFQREYERNPYDSDAWLYPTVEKLPDTDYGYDPALMLGIAIDPGLRDPTAIAFGQPIIVAGQEGVHWIDGYERAGMPPEWFAHILTGIDPEPGDTAYPFFERQGLEWSRSEQRIVDFTKSLPWSRDLVRVVMDPAGNQKHVHVDMETFWLAIVRTTRELRQRERARKGIYLDLPEDQLGLAPLWKALKGPSGSYKYRREVTLGYLPQFIFSTNDGGQLVKRRLRDAQFNEPGDKATSESKPLHNEASHMTSAVEFFCVYMSKRFMDTPKRPATTARSSRDAFRQEAA